MAQIDDFFMYENRVEGITDADYQRAKPYVEAAQAFAQTTYQSIYIIDYYRKNFLYVSDNPLFLCGHTADEVRQMGYGFYLSHVPEDEVPMLTELNRSGFRAFYDEPVENRRQCVMSYDFHITHGDRLLLVNHKITPLAMTDEGRVWLALCTVSLSPHKWLTYSLTDLLQISPSFLGLKYMSRSTFSPQTFSSDNWEREKYPISALVSVPTTNPKKR